VYNGTAALQIFTAPTGVLIRVVMIAGDPWFVAADICRALGLGNVSMAVRILDEDEKGLNPIETPGGIQSATVVNESGLYALMLRSDKAEARPFRRWVTGEVLPSIRNTGSYTIGGADAWTWHEFTAVVREATGIEASTSELKRLMRLAGILKETNAPKARWERDHFWFTGSAWTVLKRPAWKLIARIARTRAELDRTNLLKQVPGPRRPEQLVFDIPGAVR
jgi:prophage antirepressor-like protein